MPTAGSRATPCSGGTDRADPRTTESTLLTGSTVTEQLVPSSAIATTVVASASLACTMVTPETVRAAVLGRSAKRPSAAITCWTWAGVACSEREQLPAAGADRQPGEPLVGEVERWRGEERLDRHAGGVGRQPQRRPGQFADDHVGATRREWAIEVNVAAFASISVDGDVPKNCTTSAGRPGAPSTSTKSWV